MNLIIAIYFLTQALMTLRLQHVNRKRQGKRGGGVVETRTHRKSLRLQCTLGAAQATRVGMAALQFKAVKLEGPPPPTGGARSTHKREVVYLTDGLTQHRHCMGGLTVVHSPTGQSSMEGRSYPSFPTLNFLLSSGVSCASISLTTFWSRI